MAGEGLATTHAVNEIASVTEVDISWTTKFDTEAAQEPAQEPAQPGARIEYKDQPGEASLALTDVSPIARPDSVKSISGVGRTDILLGKAESESSAPGESFLSVKSSLGHRGKNTRTKTKRKIRTDGEASGYSSGPMSDAVLEDYVSNMKASGAIEDRPDDSARQALDARKVGLDGWQPSDIQDFDELSTSDEIMEAISQVLSKRDRPSGLQYLVVWAGQNVDESCWIPHESLTMEGASELIKTFEEREQKIQQYQECQSDESDNEETPDEAADENDLDDGGYDDTDDDDDDDDDEVFKDEEDLIQRRMDAMTDEHIARLLSKQEELGLGSDHLMLFDADEDSDKDEFDKYKAIEFATPMGPGQRKKSRREQKKKWADPSTLADDMLDGDDYAGFDVMDWTRPSLKSKLKHLEEAAGFGLSDSQLEDELREVWTADRKKKKAKKQEREELRVQGLLGKKNKGKPDLGAKHRGGMSMAAIREELQDFLDSDNTTLSLPPMDKKDRKIVHEIAAQFKLKSKSIGSGAKRFPVLYKTARTTRFNDAAFDRLERTITRKYFPRMDNNSSITARPARGGGGGVGGTFSYRDGETVGAGASEIGTDNRGRAMLEKMGWSKGTALGAIDNKGILVPVEHIVKKSRAGLG